MTLGTELHAVTLANGETIAYREAGTGARTLLLVHGNMTSSKHWDVLMEQLEPHYKMYALDLRGFGASTYHTRISSLKDFSEDVKAFTDALQLTSFALAGWSTGGGVAMQFAIDYPQQVEQLILIESVGIAGYPMLKKDALGQPVAGQFLMTKEEIAADPVQVAPVLQALRERNKEFYRSLWNLVIYTHKQPAPEKYEEYLEDMLTQRNLVDVDYALVTFNISDVHNGVVEGTGEARRLLTPALVIQGDRDYVVPPAMGEQIALTLPNAELMMLQNCGHSPLVDSLDELTKVIHSFLQQKAG